MVQCWTTASSNTGPTPKPACVHRSPACLNKLALCQRLELHRIACTSSGSSAKADSRKPKFVRKASISATLHSLRARKQHTTQCRNGRSNVTPDIASSAWLGCDCNGSGGGALRRRRAQSLGLFQRAFFGEHGLRPFGIAFQKGADRLIVAAAEPLSDAQQQR